MADLASGKRIWLGVSLNVALVYIYRKCDAVGNYFGSGKKGITALVAEEFDRVNWKIAHT